MQLHWDIFAASSITFGDIGVWRLSRQLVAEHGRQVRLWVDDLSALHAICPTLDVVENRCSALLGSRFITGRHHLRWNPVFDVIIEAFACELPADYIAQMAATQPHPCWINLEYLTAESWAQSCHGLASPHRRCRW